ncbi:MAG: hypothetical protein L0Z50_05115, partial [Verrucomicrobiales bacterium]|nr:hypothetical protein [Verrucomicrobiales bacterium]
MISCDSPNAVTSQFTLAHEQFPAFAKHLVRREYVTAKELLDVIEQPNKHQRRFLDFLCGVNTDEWCRWDDWAKFLARNVDWQECRETGIQIETPQLLADLTYVPEDEWPEQGEKVSFSIPAYDKQICPEAFGRW